MNVAKFSLLAIGAVALSVSLSSAVFAQDKDAKWDNPWDIKPLVPPGFVLPPNSQLSSGALGTTQTPYSATPLQSPSSSSSQQAPGIKLTIPTR